MMRLRGHIVELRAVLEGYRTRVSEGRGALHHHYTPWKGVYARFYPDSDPMSNRGWSFHTKEAGRVFARARDVLVKYPELTASEVLARATEDAGVESNELTPEDVQLLGMAVKWLITGPAGQTPRIGGAPGGPGGPFRSRAPGRLMRGRGAP